MENNSKGNDHANSEVINGELQSSSNKKISNTLYHLEILKSLRQIVRAVAIHSKKLDHDHNLTVSQLICLLTLEDKEPLTATKISEYIHVSASTVIGILDRLEEKGFIQRIRSKSDRRLVDVTITEKGLKAAKEAPPPLQDVLATSVRELPEIEQVAISLSLKKIVDLLKGMRVIAAPQLSPMLEIEDIETNIKK